eukprot:UN06961
MAADSMQHGLGNSDVKPALVRKQTSTRIRKLSTHVVERMRKAAAVCARAGEHSVAISLLHQAFLADRKPVVSLSAASKQMAGGASRMGDAEIR